MKLPRSIFVVAVLALLLRLLLGALIYTAEGSGGFLVSDSENFTAVAKNLVLGHGFSKSEIAPYVPDAKFPPVYPLLVAGSLGLTGSLMPLVALQILLASSLPLLVYSIGIRLFNEHRVSLLAAGFMALEPVIAIFSLLVLSDTVALFFLLLAAWFGLRAFQDSSLRATAHAGFFLALSTLTRPQGQYLFYVALLFGLILLGLGFRRVGSPRKILSSLGIFIALFLLVVSPWVYRNYLQFRTLSVSSTGLRNLYVDLAPSIVSLETGEAYKTTEHRLNLEFMKKYGVQEERELYENPALGTTLAKEGVTIMLQHPAATAKVLAVVAPSFFTQDLYFYYAFRFGLTKGKNIDFSPSLLLIHEGPIRLLKSVWGSVGVWGILGFLGRMVWVAITLLALWGFIRGIRHTTARGATIFLALIILFYAATSVVAGFSDQGRFRYPADAFIFLLLAYGWYHMRSGTTSLLVSKSV